MSRYILPILALLATSALAQTSSSCNPRNSTCPADPALGTTLTQVFNNTKQVEFSPDLWTVAAGTDLISFGDNGAQLALQNDKDTVTLVSTFYIFWGVTEMVFKAAPGQGIISTVILLSDDLDEIDWEILGGNDTNVENNWYGFGNQTQINSEWPTIPDAQTEFHNYTIDWSQERIQYIVNGNVVREVPYAAPGEYPQSPCRVQFGIWCGGCSDRPGTVQWAGGKPDWSEAPFVMNIQSLRVVDGTQNASSYSYGDHSGLWSSINVTPGDSKAYQAINKLNTFQNAEKHWNGLSQGAKIGIAVGVLGSLLIFSILFGFYCMKQRKAGRAEAALHEKEWQQQNAELMEYRSMMAKGHFAVDRQSVMMDAKPMSPGRRF